MGSRSRKRGRPAAPETSAPAAAPAATPTPAPAATEPRAHTPGPLDEFSAIAAPAPAAPPAPTAPEKPAKLRGEAANEAIRANLKPLQPGERPAALVVATVVASLTAIANIIATAVGAGAGDSSSGAGDAVPFTIISTGVLGLAAVGMWRARYWGIMGFQVILAFQILILSVAISRVQRWWFGIILVIVIVLLGWLFWKLIRVLSRVQMPERPAP